MGTTKTDEKPPYILPAPILGVNTRAAQTRLEPGSYSMLKNLDWNEEVGIWKLRRGTSLIGSVAVPGTAAVRGGIRWYWGATPTAQTVFGHNTSLFAGDSSPSAIGTGYTANGEWFFQHAADILYAANGLDAMQRWNPSSTQMRAAGFAAPNSAPSVATGAAGVLTGGYSYKVTFVYDSDATHESSASTASANVNPSSQQVDLSSIPTGGTGCTARRIYRTRAGGTLYYFLTTINDNATTTLSDNTADSGLTTTVQAPVDNGIPPVGNIFLIHNGAMYVASGNRLRRSAIASTERNPLGTLTVHGAGLEIFPASHFIDVGDDNTPITGLAPWGNGIVIFKHNDIYILRGTTFSDMELWRTAAGVGCIAPRTIVTMPGNGLWFLGRSDTSFGVFAFTGAVAKPVSDAIEPTLRANVLMNAASVKPCAGLFRGRYLLAYQTAGAGSPTDQQFEIADCDTKVNGRWQFHENVAPACWIPYTGANDSGQMYIGWGNAGRLVQWEGSFLGDFNSGDLTNPRDTAMYFETGWMPLSSAHRMKPLKEIYVVWDGQTSTTLTLQRLYDFATATSVTTAGAAAQAFVSSMDNATTGRSVMAHSIDCQRNDGVEMGDSGAVDECAYFVKLKVTVTPSVPNATTSATVPIRVQEVAIYFSEKPPTKHGVSA